MKRRVFPSTGKVFAVGTPLTLSHVYGSLFVAIQCLQWIDVRQG